MDRDKLAQLDENMAALAKSVGGVGGRLLKDYFRTLKKSAMAGYSAGQSLGGKVAAPIERRLAKAAQLPEPQQSRQLARRAKVEVLPAVEPGETDPRSNPSAQPTVHSELMQAMPVGKLLKALAVQLSMALDVPYSDAHTAMKRLIRKSR